MPFSGIGAPIRLSARRPQRPNTRSTFLTANRFREFRASRLKPPLTVAQAHQTYRKVPATSRLPGLDFFLTLKKTDPPGPMTPRSPRPGPRFHQ
jgi:hypothetical protein